MNTPVFTDDDLTRLAAQVDADLQALSATSTPADFRGAQGQSTMPLPPKQSAQIEAASGEPAHTFWEKYKLAARKDLCEEDGMLYQQWHKWKDLSSKDVVKSSTGILVGMGVAQASIPVLAVAASVVLLNVVLNIGIKAVCDDGDTSSNGDTPPSHDMAPTVTP